MRFTTLLFLGVSFLTLTTCDGLSSRQSQSSVKPIPHSEQLGTTEQLNDTEGLAKQDNRNSVANPGPATTNVSLNQADAANAASQAFARKIIRDANLIIEVSSPAETQ